MFELPVDPWEKLIGCYVLIDGEKVACESEFDLNQIIEKVFSPFEDEGEYFTIDLYDSSHNTVGEIDPNGLDYHPYEHDWDAVRKEMIEEQGL